VVRASRTSIGHLYFDERGRVDLLLLLLVLVLLLLLLLLFLVLLLLLCQILLRQNCWDCCRCH